jgi:hypothetical protein
MVRWKSTDVSGKSACHLLSRSFLRSWKWKRHVPPKRRLTVNGLHGVISHENETPHNHRCENLKSYNFSIVAYRPVVSQTSKQTTRQQPLFCNGATTIELLPETVLCNSLLGSCNSWTTTVERGCFLCGPCWGVALKKIWAASLGPSQLRVEFCMGGCEDRIWERKAEEFPLLDAVARERLTKAQQARKWLSGCCDDL